MKDGCKKLYVYFIRGIGLIILPITIHIGLFHSEIFKKYPILTLLFILIFNLTDYKVNYKEIKNSKKVIILILYLASCIFCGYVLSLIHISEPTRPY